MGYGLTSFDADLDGRANIVEVDSEATLAQKTGVPALDFDGNGRTDPLDADERFLSGDEIVVFSIAPTILKPGGRLQFLDHMVQVESVVTNSVTVRLWYTGDLLPADMGTQTISLGDVWTYKVRMPGIQATSGSNLGPFYVQAISIDPESDLAQIRVGRALGMPYASIATAEPNAFLKRFYVDGHEYNVVAIGTEGSEGFRFITLRTPVPTLEELVTIDQHSVRLQGYGANVQLSVLPPYNYQHYFVKDIQRNQTGKIIGELIGPVAPILHNLVGAGQATRYPAYGISYQNPREMGFAYVGRDQAVQFRGQLQGEYTETLDGKQTWQDHTWRTQPSHFVEFLLPDVQGADDLYLLTSAFETAQQDGGRGKFWFDPVAGKPIHTSPAGLRLYGMKGEGPGDRRVVTDTVGGFFIEAPPFTDPTAPFDPAHDQAPTMDFLTFNAALMSEFGSCEQDPLRSQLYGQIAIESQDAREKAWLRMWYEPEHLDQIIATRGGEAIENRYPAIMQEFTYGFLDTADNPTHARPGWGVFAFPVGATFNELFDRFGFGSRPSTPTSMV